MKDAAHPYPRLARLTVERHLSGQGVQQRDIDAISADASLWKEPKACFVSIKTRAGTLRGCIGTILPAQPSLDREIVMNAVSAAVRDHRFAPMRAEELDNVVFSVDVLGVPEPVQDPQSLDPAVWGVIVIKEGRRGLLLPDLPGVVSVEQQISIAAQKAGIHDLNGVQLQRFTVTRYPEE